MRLPLSIKRASLFFLLLSSTQFVVPTISKAQPVEIEEESILLNFEPRDLRNPTSKLPSVPKKEINNISLKEEEITVDDLFEGGSDSLVAITVGSAEGTRDAYGTKTWAYSSHIDPGNGARNQGSFSYQHGASSAEDADIKQSKRLRNQIEVIIDQSRSKGLTLGLNETLNAIDLANQAPLAALDKGGFIDRLYEIKNKGLEGDEAILEARTLSYIDPSTGKWAAPGLGNTYESVKRDQARRQDEIKKAKEIQLPKLKSKIKSKKGK